MEPVIDLEKEYGVVLEGGGAKGAYQIGAWRALWEAGVRSGEFPEPAWGRSTEP